MAVVAANQPNPTSIATDGVSVYWTNLGTLDTAVDGGAPPQPGAVMACTIGGGGSGPSAAAESPGGASDVVLDAKSFYWVKWNRVNGNAIMKSAK